VTRYRAAKKQPPGTTFRLGEGEDCPGDEHNQDPGHHSEQGAEEVGVDDAAHLSVSLGAGRNRLYAGDFRLLARGKQAR
jgi:hypothetical protein